MLFDTSETLAQQSLLKIEALGDVVLQHQILRGAIHRARPGTDPLSRDALQSRVEKAELERLLGIARKRPWRSMADLIWHRFATLLARQPFIRSEKTRGRLVRSASKRDPDRGLRRFGPTVDRDQSLGGSGQVDLAGLRKNDPSLATVLVVSHDGGRTGAPILALNIAQKLANRYNVVTLLLRTGDLAEEFRATSIDVAIARKLGFSGVSNLPIIDRLTRKHGFSFAIVNSMDSRGVLQGLRQRNVPTVSLIHEFSSYASPRDAALGFFQLSDETVFSAKVTLENAIQETKLVTAPRAHVIPQGKCAIPGKSAKIEGMSDEARLLTNFLRPTGADKRSFVVIGAGTVNFRKGVDLFIEVATRVLSGPGGERFRFAWIGSGYEPDHDFGYSIYLRDQIRRAGIEERMLMLPETSEIEVAYREADALLLTSRLDPLPNVAIDALSAGKPVFCFDRTTGIADILTDNGLGAECVATYLDTSEMADKIRAVAESVATYEMVATRSKALAGEVFDMDAYIAKLDALGLQAAARVKVRRANE